MYTIRVNTYAKIFSIVMKGTLSETESQSLAAEFQNEVRNIEPSDYALLIDTKELDAASGEESSAAAEQVRGLAQAAPFKVRYSF